MCWELALDERLVSFEVILLRDCGETTPRDGYIAANQLSLQIHQS